MRELAHPDWVRRLNYLGDAVGDPRHVAGLEPDELLATARATAGFTDLGEDDWPGWTETFERQVSAINAEANLHLLGRVLTRSEILRVVQTWLRLQDAWQATPGATRRKKGGPEITSGPPKPTTDNQQPATGNQQPATSNQQPTSFLVLQHSDWAD